MDPADIADAVAEDVVEEGQLDYFPYDAMTKIATSLRIWSIRHQGTVIGDHLEMAEGYVRFAILGYLQHNGAPANGDAPGMENA